MEEIMTNEQVGILILWGIVGSLFILLILGWTNRIVIFFNGADVFWTISPAIFMILALIVNFSLMPEGMETLDEALNSENSKIYYYVFIGGGVLSLVGVIISFATSIHYNGVVLGVVVGIFKLLAAIFVVTFSVLALIFALDSSRDRQHSTASNVIYFMGGFIIAWLVRKFVNGNSFLERKELIREANLINQADS